jgi:hypothetical protein
MCARISLVDGKCESQRYYSHTRIPKQARDSTTNSELLHGDAAEDDCKPAEMFPLRQRKRERYRFEGYVLPKRKVKVS